VSIAPLPTAHSSETRLPTPRSCGPSAGVCESEATVEGELATKPIWHGAVVAQSDDTVVVEGNHYFPADSINAEASYKTVVVDGERNSDGVWYYPEPKDAAVRIKDRFAFWHGAEVTA